MDGGVVRVGVEHGQDHVPELSQAAAGVIAHDLLHDRRQGHVTCICSSPIKSIVRTNIHIGGLMLSASLFEEPKTTVTSIDRNNEVFIIEHHTPPGLEA